MLCFLEKRLAEKSIFKRLPPLTPPYTGGELIAKRFLPLCKGELEGVVSFYIYSEFHQNKKIMIFLLKGVTYPSNSRYTLCIHNQGMLLDG